MWWNVPYKKGLGTENGPKKYYACLTWSTTWWNAIFGIKKLLSNDRRELLRPYYCAFYEFALYAGRGEEGGGGSGARKKIFFLLETNFLIFFFFLLFYARSNVKNNAVNLYIDKMSETYWFRYPVCFVCFCFALFFPCPHSAKTLTRKSQKSFESKTHALFGRESCDWIRTADIDPPPHPGAVRCGQVVLKYVPRPFLVGKCTFWRRFTIPSRPGTRFCVRCNKRYDSGGGPSRVGA